MREASARLLVQLTGQCEGLQLWNEQLVRLSRFIVDSQNREPLAQQSNQMFHHIFPLLKIIFQKLKKPVYVAIVFIATAIMTACSSSKTIGLVCQERQIEIYVDDEYLGRDLVYYTVPKGREYIEVSCRENGMEVYHRRINIADKKGTLIELQIPKNYKYSNKPF